jgi:hypothetical protein
MDTTSDTMNTDIKRTHDITYNTTYYQEHKEKLNHDRIKNYHKNRNNIPTKFYDNYIENRKVYNLIKKNKTSLNKELILHLLEQE